MTLRIHPSGYPHAWQCEVEGCVYVVFAGLAPVEYYDRVASDHMAQHAPGRVLDIRPEWTVSAICTGCDEAVDLTVEDGWLVCPECGARWDINGNNGWKEATDE